MQLFVAAFLTQMCDVSWLSTLPYDGVNVQPNMKSKSKRMVCALFKAAALTQVHVCKPVVTRVSLRCLRALIKGKPSFSHSHRWRLARLPNLVCSDTNIFPSSKAGWRAFFNLCFSRFSLSQSWVVSQWYCFHCLWGCVLNCISAMTGGTGCCFSFSLLMVFLEVFNLKQLTDWPYSKITLIAAVKQPLEWWTERQSRKQATRLEPLELP